MRDKIFNKRLFIRILGTNTLATVLRMISGFVSIKIIAILLGPSGIALLGQLNNFVTIFMAISTGGITLGVTKYIAEYQFSKKKVNDYIKTALVITFCFSLTVSLFLFSFSELISNLVFGENGYSYVFVTFSATVGLYSLNSLLIAILNGFKEFYLYAKINVIGSFVSLIFSSFLAFYFGVIGALLATVTYQSIVFFIAIYFSIKFEWFDLSDLRKGFNKFYALRLSKYSLMALTSAICIPLSQLIVRRYLVESFSYEEAGVWEGMNRVSGMYLLVITTSLSVYYLPRLSELKNDIEISNEIISVGKLLLPILLFITTIIYLFRNLIINILFDSNFSNMSELFALQLIGDFFKISAWLIGYQLVAKSMTRLYVITEIIFSLSWVLLSFFFVDMIGFKGANVAYCINYVIYFILMLILFRNMFLFNRQSPVL